MPGPMTFNQLVNEIDKWIIGNAAKVIAASMLKGGWEGWLQVEITNHLNSTFMGLVFAREVLVYDDQKRCDLVVNYTPDARVLPDPRSIIIVEIKCESLQNSTAFAKGFESDVSKLKDGPFGDGFKMAARVAYGFYFSRGSEIIIGAMPEVKKRMISDELSYARAYFK